MYQSLILFRGFATLLFVVDGGVGLSSQSSYLCLLKTSLVLLTDDSSQLPSVVRLDEVHKSLLSLGTLPMSLQVLALPLLLLSRPFFWKWSGAPVLDVVV
jgi:hypothetical protein